MNRTMVAIRVRRLADICKAMLGVVEETVGRSWTPELGFGDSSHMVALGRTRSKDGDAGTP